MVTYPEKVATIFPEEIKGYITSPAAEHLFRIRRNDTQELI